MYFSHCVVLISLSKIGYTHKGLFLDSLFSSIGLDYCCFEVGFEISKYEISNSVLFQDCFIYLRSLEIPYQFCDEFFYFCKKGCWALNKDYTGSVYHEAPFLTSLRPPGLARESLYSLGPRHSWIAVWEWTQLGSAFPNSGYFAVSSGLSVMWGHSERSTNSGGDCSAICIGTFTSQRERFFSWKIEIFTSKDSSAFSAEKRVPCPSLNSSLSLGSCPRQLNLQ